MDHAREANHPHSLSSPVKTIDLSGVKAPPEHIDLTNGALDSTVNGGGPADIRKIIGINNGVIPP
jgi:hypothetical protein